MCAPTLANEFTRAQSKKIISRLGNWPWGQKISCNNWAGASPTASNDGSPRELQSAFGVNVHCAMQLPKVPGDGDLPTMTKAELADLLFEQVGLNKHEAKDRVEAFFDEISDALERGESVKLTGSGIFNSATKSPG